MCDDGYVGRVPMCDEKKNNCDHEWNKFYVHKLGELQECQKCNIIVRSGQDKT